MAHMNKYARSAVGQLCQHYERKKKEDGEYVKFGNEDIDLTKTHLNYNLAPERNLKGQIEFINQRCSEVKCLNRKDVNVMVSWVVTQPKDFPQERSREFFEKTYEFLNTRYGGEQNVISAYVHLDEKSAHMHYAFVPVVADKKSKKLKVSAKEAVTMRDLKTFHQDLEKILYWHFGFEVGIINGATAEGNLSIKALKLKSEVEGLVEKKNDLQQGVRHYEDLQVDIEDVSDIGSKSLIGKNISVSPDKYALLQEQAKAYRANKPRIEQLAKKERKISDDFFEKAQQLSKCERQLKADEQRNDEAKRINDKTYKQVQELFDTATLGQLTPQTYGDMKSEIANLSEENRRQSQANKKLEQKLEDSVPRAVHDDVVFDYNQSRSQAQSLQRRLSLSEDLLKTASDTNTELKKEIAEKDKLIDNLKLLCQGIYECFRNAISAVKLFKYGKGKYRVDGLSEEQGRLIDSLMDYGVKWAKADGFPDIFSPST